MSEVLGKCLNCKNNVIREESYHCNNCEGFYCMKCVKIDVNGVDAKLSCVICGNNMGYATTFETDEELKELT